MGIISSILETVSESVMDLPRDPQWEGESQEYFLEEVAVALGQQAGAFDWAKGQRLVF